MSCFSEIKTEFEDIWRLFSFSQAENSKRTTFGGSSSSPSHGWAEPLLAGDDGEDRHSQGAAGVFGSSGGVEAKQGGDSRGSRLCFSRPPNFPSHGGCSIFVSFPYGGLLKWGSPIKSLCLFCFPGIVYHPSSYWGAPMTWESRWASSWSWMPKTAWSRWSQEVTWKKSVISQRCWEV